MGKRRRISGFINGFEQGYSLFGKVMKDRDMNEIADAQVEEVAKTRDATDVEIARAKAETEAIAAQDVQTFGESADDYGMGSKVQDGTRFQYLGNDYDTAPTAGQKNSARLAAMAGVLEKHGDPERALNLRAAGIQAEETERSRADQDELRSVFARGINGEPAEKPGQPATAHVPTSAPLMPQGAAQPTLPGASSTQRTQQTDEDVGLDRYLQKVAPRAIQTMLKHGNVEAAQKFQQYVDSEQGRAYSKRWLGGVRMLSVGDNHGAIKAFEKMYNDQAYDDGRTVKLVPNEDGSEYAVEHYGQDGQLLRSLTKKTADLAKEAALALEPTAAVKFMAEQETKRAGEAAALEKQVLIENHKDQRDLLRDEARDRRAEDVEDRRDARLTRQLSSMERRTGGQSDRITLSQQSSNAEIDAARRRVAGITGDEVRRRTQQFTATGRENPDFDPQLASWVRKANERKVGDDRDFDRFNAPKAQPNQAAAMPDAGRQPAKAAQQPAAQPSYTRADVAKRFRSDRGMDRYKLGKETPQGIEVLSGNKLVGYYR